MHQQNGETPGVRLPKQGKSLRNNRGRAHLGNERLVMLTLSVDAVDSADRALEPPGQEGTMALACHRPGIDQVPAPEHAHCAGTQRLCEVKRAGIIADE